MPIITLSPEKMLRKEFFERAILTKMKPYLYFLDIFPVVDLGGATNFSYFIDEENAEDDIQKGVMSEPLPVSELSDLTKIDISTITKKTGDTYQFGYAFEYSEAKLKENGFIDEVARAMDRMAYGMARKINGDIFNAMDTFAQGNAITLNDGSWDNSAQINDDIIDLKYSFEDQTFQEYTFTDMFLNSNQVREANKFYTALNGSFNMNDVEDVKFTNTKQAVTDGTAYCIDKNVKPITIYKNVNPLHSTLSNPVSGLININTYTQDKYPFKKGIEVWAEMGIGCHHPDAILKQTGL